MIDLLDRIRQAGGAVEVVGGDLRLRLPKGLLTAAERSILAAHKAEVVRLLAAGPVVETPVEVTMPEPVEEPLLDQDTGSVWETAVDPPPPCQQCGSLELWQDLSGSWHCQHCEPPLRSERLREQAARLRQGARAKTGQYGQWVQYAAKGPENGGKTVGKRWENGARSG